MRIALVTPSFPPQVGGVEEHVSQLARGLVSLGSDVHVLAQVKRNDTSPVHEVTADGVTVHRFRDWTRTDHFQIAPALMMFLRANRDRFDLVHAHSFHAWPALAASSTTRGPFVFTPHYHGVGHTQAARVLHRLYDPVAEKIFRRASIVVCVSRMEADLIRRDYPNWFGEIDVIPNGIDLLAIECAEPYESGDLTIVVAGRIEHYKQIDLVVNAMMHTPIGARLVVIGDGPARQSLESLVAKLKLQAKISILGQVESLELRRWQRTADVIVSMSRHESYGLVLTEGVGAGARVIASDIPAHVELAQRFAGYIDLISVDASAHELATAIDESMARPRVTSSAPLLGWADMAREVNSRYKAAISTFGQR